MSAAGAPASIEALAVGEPLVAMIARQHNVALHEVDGYGVHVVGAELNVAVGLARLGHSVAFAGRVGADPFGERIRRRLLAERVDIRWLVEDPHRPTGMLFRNLRTTASPEVVYRRAGSAGSALSPADVGPALEALTPGAVTILSGVTAAVCPEAAAQTVRAARERGGRVCLDLNHRARLWDRETAAAALASLASAAQIVVGGVEEASLVTGTTDLDRSARALLDGGAEIVVLRDDVAASHWYARGASDPVRGHGHVRDAVDPVGAGDAFLAGLLSGVLSVGIDDPAGCLARAHACAFAVVDTVGDIEGALHRDELPTAGGQAGGRIDARR